MSTESATDALMDLVRQFHPEASIDDLGEITLTRTNDHVIVLSRMLFNWRLQVTPPGQLGWTYTHGYCYYGTGPATLVRALGAAETWDPGPALDVPPIGYDKQAY